LLKLTVVFLIISFDSSRRDCQNEVVSVGLPSDASYKLSRKLHQIGNSVEDALETRREESKCSFARKRRHDRNKHDARMLAAGLQILASNNALDESQIIVMEELFICNQMENSFILSVPSMDVGGSIQNVCNIALTRCCLSGWCHCKNVGNTLQDSMQSLSGNA